MDYMNYYDYGYGTGALAALAGAFLGILIVVLLVLIAMYIFNSIGIMTIAKNRGLNNPWLVWIPFVGSYTLGAIADDIAEKNGESSVFRYLLLGFSLGNLVLGFILPDSVTYLISIALYVLNVVALNRMFKAYRPQSATSWTVLCAIPITAIMQSIFPFVMRNDQPTDGNE